MGGALCLRMTSQRAAKNERMGKMEYLWMIWSPASPPDVANNR